MIEQRAQSSWLLQIQEKKFDKTITNNDQAVKLQSYSQIQKKEKRKPSMSLILASILPLAIQSRKMLQTYQQQASLRNFIQFADDGSSGFIPRLLKYLKYFYGDKTSIIFQASLLCFFIGKNLFNYSLADKILKERKELARRIFMHDCKVAFITTITSFILTLGGVAFGTALEEQYSGNNYNNNNNNNNKIPTFSGFSFLIGGLLSLLTSLKVNILIEALIEEEQLKEEKNYIEALKTLDLASNVDQQYIENRIKNRLQVLHPDKNKGIIPAQLIKNQETTQKIQQAFETIREYRKKRLQWNEQQGNFI